MDKNVSRALPDQNPGQSIPGSYSHSGQPTAQGSSLFTSRWPSDVATLSSKLMAIEGLCFCNYVRCNVGLLTLFIVNSSKTSWLKSSLRYNVPQNWSEITKILNEKLKMAMSQLRKRCYIIVKIIYPEGRMDHHCIN